MWQVEESFGLWKCCNGHDVCYSSCGASFAHCESTFKTCMTQVCDALDQSQRSACHEQARSFTGMTGIFGAASHRMSQQGTCTCVPKAQKRAAWLAFLSDLHTRGGQAASEEELGALLDAHKGKEGQLGYRAVRQFGEAFVEKGGTVPVSFFTDSG